MYLVFQIYQWLFDKTGKFANCFDRVFAMTSQSQFFSRVLRAWMTEMKAHHAEKWATIPTLQAPPLLNFGRLIFIWASIGSGVSLYNSPIVKWSSNRWILLMRSTITNLSQALDRDLADKDPLGQRAPFHTFDPTLYDLPCCLQNLNWH